MNPEILSPITEIERIAEGKRIRILKYLTKRYGGKNWKKKKRTALIKDPYTGLPVEQKFIGLKLMGLAKLKLKENDGWNDMKVRCICN